MSLWIISFALVVSVGSMIALTRYAKLHPFFSLLIGALICGWLVGTPFTDIISQMQEGFGLLLRQIGFLVALGSCLGIMLEKTGAMVKISNTIVHAFGKSRASLALSITGVVVGIPVFCDSGFIILSRLIPTMASEASIVPAELSLSLSSGLYTTHTLVPPTPGPLAVVMNLNAGDHIGEVMMWGIIASFPVGLVAWLLARKLAKGITSELPVSETIQTGSVSTWFSFVPLILPILLIAASSLPKLLDLPESLTQWMGWLGIPVVALSIGLVLSFFLLNGSQQRSWPSWFQEALKDAGIVLLITGAGGAFGAVIKASGVDKLLTEYFAHSSSQGIFMLVVAFGIAAALKTAQGSTTTAMIITSGLLAPLAPGAGFDQPKEIAALVLAIGGGGMTVSHANDSYFWVVSQFGGIAAKDAFRSFTILTLMQGLTALVCSILIFLIG